MHNNKNNNTFKHISFRIFFYLINLNKEKDFRGYYYIRDSFTRNKSIILGEKLQTIKVKI